MSKNNLYSLLLCFFAFIPTLLLSQPSGKQKFTHKELNNIPKGIVNSIMNPSKWIDKSNLILGKYEGGTYKEFIYNIDTKKITPYQSKKMVNEKLDVLLGKNVTYSPDSTMVAFTKDNDLYSLDIATKKETRYTYDGSNTTLNGWASWVYYEEILGRSTRYKAFWWSNDSKKLAFYKFDDSKVPMFPIYNANEKYGTLTETRYPKAGENNPTVQIGIIDIESFKNGSGSIIWGDFDQYSDQYFGTPYWSYDSNLFIVPWMTREQNEMIIYKIDPNSGVKVDIYKESQPTWIDWVEEASFTQKGVYMVRDFEMWEQIYFLSYDGSGFKKLTDGRNWNIKILKVDEKNNLLFFSSCKEISTRSDIYRLNLKNNKIDRISFGNYTFGSVVISPDNKYFATSFSNVSTPTKVAVVSTIKCDKIEVIDDSRGENFDKYCLATPEMIFIKSSDGKYTLPGSIILPIDLDSTKRYPVIIDVYGGPGSPQVSDRWRNPSKWNQWWANEGVIQITIDSRTAGHSGKEGMNCAHRNMGSVSLEDYITWAKYLRTLPYVDSTKIGITGFSFGGTMTVLALTDGNQYFKYGIAGGGVYDWTLYDSHYTERFMDLPDDNLIGYLSERAISKVSKYVGDKTSMLKITHGTSDDNVHFQNTLQLVDALINEGKIFELMIYPGGYHGYRGLQGDHYNKENMIFWYKYLLEKEFVE